MSKVGFWVSLAVGLYANIIGLLTTQPAVQRFAVYAHKINTLFAGDKLNKPEAFGFAERQVTPFNLETPDGETLYAWHVLPVDVYARNERALRGEERPAGPVEDFTTTSAFRLLTTEEPEPAKVVVTCASQCDRIPM